MSASSDLDVRLPIGALFILLGLLLALYGVVARADASSGTRVNLWWGVVMLLFGLLMVWLGGRRGSRAA